MDYILFCSVLMYSIATGVLSECQNCCTLDWNGCKGCEKSLPSPENGNISYIDVYLVQYSCSAGYYLNGTAMRYCIRKDNGNRIGYWNGTTPSCENIEHLITSTAEKTHAITTSSHSTITKVTVTQDVKESTTHASIDSEEETVVAPTSPGTVTNTVTSMSLIDNAPSITTLKHGVGASENAYQNTIQPSEEEEQSLSVALIIGVVAAAMATTISVFVIIYCYRKRRKTNKEGSKETTKEPRKDKAHLNKVPPSTADKDNSATSRIGYYNIEQTGSVKHEGNVMIVAKSDENNSICQVNAEPEEYENTKRRYNIHAPHCNTDFAEPNYENDSLRSLENNGESTDKTTKSNACGTGNVYLNMPTTDYENTRNKLSQVPARNPGICEPGVYEQLEASPYQNTDRTKDDREYTQLHV